MNAKDMLGKVRALLDTAESFEEQGNAEAAASYRAKAHALRDKYRIEEEELLAQDPTAVEPVLITIDLVRRGSAYQGHYLSLWTTIARHAGIRSHLEWSFGDTGYTVVARAVGYEGDIRYAELIYTNARLAFAERLEPKVNPALTEQVNVYRLRSAGIERVRVADMVWGNRDKANLSKVGRLYKAECQARGEEAALSGRGVTGAVYREHYANQFVDELSMRLRRAQDGAGQYGGGLVLHGRQERVDEAFYSHFPNYRPKPAIEQATPEQCERCQAAQKRKGDPSATCKDHKPWTPTAKDRAAWARYNSPTAQRGRQAGAAAARQVELNRDRREAVE